MITQAEFTKCLHALYGIEGWQVQGLFGAAQHSFEADSPLFFFEATPAIQAAIWREVEKRQNIHMLDDRVQP